MDAEVTPYSTVKPYLGDLPAWVPEVDQERIAAYFKYDDIYWSRPECFKLAVVDEDSGPIYVPKARTVVDTTAHYLLKGLSITAPQGNAEMKGALDALFKREKFISKFHTAKHSGVSRGDFILHMRADKGKKEGKRISIDSVHPAAYFPVYDEANDPDKLLRVHLAEPFARVENGMVRSYIRKLTYEYEYRPGDTRKVWRTEGFFAEKDWFDPSKQEMIQSLLKREQLPDEIDTIPVYHFRNSAWQGEEFGSSELRGFERLLQAINQTITDEEVALALEGLGVYATDASGPQDPETKQRVPWQIAPARVMEVPLGSYFKRVEGVGSVTPMLDHVKYLVEALFEASATSDVARGAVEASQIAGVALAIKFMPTLAKVEVRDQDGIETLQQMFYDWKQWHSVFESEDLGDDEVEIVIGDKLPQDKTAKLNELNNMFDRKVISAAYYRQEMTKLGYEFPDDIEAQIDSDAQKRFEEAQKLAALQPKDDPANDAPGKSGVAGRPRNPRRKTGNKSNNSGRPNESGATEA